MIPLGYSIPGKHASIGFRKEEKKNKKNKIIYDKSEAHLLTIAPTGAGKGRGNIIPTCLTYPGSLILIDVKGEAAKVTAKAREKFGEVFIVDPFKVVTKDPAKFNPLEAAVNGGPVEQQGVMIAKAFQSQGPSISSEQYWDNKAHELLSALCIQALTTNKNFKEMRGVLYGDSVYDLAVMLDNKTINNKLAYELISAYLQLPDVTRTCVLSTAQQNVAILGDPAVLDSLEGPTSFNIPSLIAGKPMTIYFVIPPNKLIAYSVLLRLWITSLLNIVTERTKKPRKSTLFIIDECANLGRLDGLLTAVTLLRSYGFRIWSIFQDPGQLKQLYKEEWTTIINNCDVFQTYGFKSYMLAKQIAEIIGSKTAAELMKMPAENAILMRAGEELEIIKRLDYLTDTLFKDKGFNKNPFY